MSVSFANTRRETLVVSLSSPEGEHVTDKHQPGPEERKPYSPPAVTEFGTVEDLTRGGGGVAADFPSGSSRSG